MMKETLCSAENCKEKAVFFLGVDVEVKCKATVSCEKTRLQTPLCKTHATIFSLAHEFMDYSWNVEDMQESLQA